MTSAIRRPTSDRARTSDPAGAHDGAVRRSRGGARENRHDRPATRQANPAPYQRFRFGKGLSRREGEQQGPDEHALHKWHGGSFRVRQTPIPLCDLMVYKGHSSSRGRSMHRDTVLLRLVPIGRRRRTLTGIITSVGAAETYELRRLVGLVPPADRHQLLVLCRALVEESSNRSSE